MSRGERRDNDANQLLGKEQTQTQGRVTQSGSIHCRERPVGFGGEMSRVEEVRGEVRGPFCQVTEEHTVVSRASPLLTPTGSPEVFL